MFPLRKLRELSPRTRLRKTARILQSIEIDLLHGRELDFEYVRGLLDLLAVDEPSAAVMELLHSGGIGAAAAALARSVYSGSETAVILRGVNSLRNDILAAIGAEPSEWDLIAADTGNLDRSGVDIRPIAVYLEDIRSPYNVGSIFRTAEAFGIERIYLSPRTPLPTHPRAQKTAKNAERAMLWEVRELATFTGASDVFALEVGGTPIREFAFPHRGIVLLGSEELGLSPEALRLADAGTGRVSIPLPGAKRSLNVAVAFGILMAFWRDALDRKE